MIAFTAAAAADYDVRIPRLVPGYDLAQDMAAAILADELMDDARILVAGCGTGGEILRLAGENAGWRFTGLDPAHAMLVHARARLAEAGHAQRVQWKEAELGGPGSEEVAPDHDAALAFLVDHFIADDGARAGFFRALAAGVKPGAPVLLFHYDAHEWPGPYLHWLRARGFEDAAAQAVLTRIDMLWHPLPSERLDALLNEAGLEPPRTFLRALSYRGLSTRKI